MAASKLTREMSQERLYSTLLVIGTLIVSALLLHWHVQETQGSYERTQQALMQQSTLGAARSIEQILGSVRRGVEFLAAEESELIARLAADPGDEQAYLELTRSLEALLPGHMAFTIADPDGSVLLDDLEGRVGDVCQADILQFAAGRHLQQIFIHPNPLGHHFDVMANWSHEGRAGIFFVSFDPRLIANVLDNSQLHGHRLLVLHRDRTALLEITAAGARDRMDGETVLPPTDLERIGYRVEIPGTRWELVDLPAPGLFAGHRTDLRRKAVHVFLLLLGFAGLMLWLIRREENLRTAAELDLVESHDQLERRVRERSEQLTDANRRLRREFDQRQHAQQQLSDSETRYALAAQVSSEGLWELRFDHDEVYLCPRWRELLGIAEGSGQEQALFWYERVHPEDLPSLQSLLADCREGRRDRLEVDLRMRHGDGSWRPYRCRGVAERDDEGKTTRIAGSLTAVEDRPPEQAAASAAS